jgi:hypothetical protein
MVVWPSIVSIDGKRTRIEVRLMGVRTKAFYCLHGGLQEKHCCARLTESIKDSTEAVIVEVGCFNAGTEQVGNLDS